MAERKIKKLGGFLGIAGIIVYILSIVFHISFLFIWASGHSFNLICPFLIFLSLISFTISAFLGKKLPMIFCSFFVLVLSLISIYSLYGHLLDFTLAVRDTAKLSQLFTGVIPELDRIPYRLIVPEALKPFLPTALLSIFYIIFTLKFFKSDKL